MGHIAEKIVAQSDTPNPIADSFLSCLQSAHHETWPFDFWLLQNPLPIDVVNAICQLPFAPPRGTSFDGRRETNNSTRVYFSRENQYRYGVCQQVVTGFKDAAVMSAIEQVTGTDLTNTRLRIEYCQDTDGFWLEPHTDISVKKFTMLVYLSNNADLAAAGTEIYDGPPDFKHVTSAPYGRNKGVIFIPGANTWHGVGKGTVKGLRKSIIINYVSPAWSDTWELA